jgi:two-component system, cell cycle sensor histidine kinase and response regulator CckA
MTSARPSILLIEDDRVYARFVEASLAKSDDWHGRILHARTLEEGLARLERTSAVALVLLDLGLPDSDGFDTFLRVRDAAPDKAIVILSGRDDQGLPNRAVEAGAQDYIVKGTSGEGDLARACTYALARKQSELAIRRMAQQQAAVAALGQRALSGCDQQELCEEAVAVVRRTLGTEYAEIYEAQHTEAPFLLRAMAGADPPNADTSVAPGAASDVALAHAGEQPVVYTDGTRDGRFVVTPWQRQASIRAGACVVIRGHGGPFGVLAAHARDPRTFSREDVHFLELVANVLGATVAREQVEEVFRVSEAGYRHILDTASEGICAINADGEVTYVNRRAVEMLGYPGTEAFLGRPLMEFLFDEDHAVVDELLRRWNQGVQSQFDFRLRCHGGAELWVLASTSPILDQDGRFAGALAMFTDVTARRAAEKALRESEARYRRIVETANEGIWFTGARWKTEYVNRVMADMLGYPVEEVAARTLSEFLFEDDREAVLTELDERRRVVREPIEVRFRRKGGAELWVRASTSPVLGGHGESEGLLAMCTDVTARRRSDAERARLSSAVEQAAEAIMITRRDGTIVYVNPAWQRLTGYSTTDVLGRTPRVLKAPGQDPGVYRDLWETILEGGVWRGEITNRHQSGELFTWEETITPVRDASGRIIEFIAFGEDISGKRDLEARLRQSQKMEAIGRLAGGIAHDFNNLLTVITGYSERLLSGLADDDPMRKGAEAIKRSADRAAALTQQLLAFSRRQILSPKVLDLNTVVGNMNKLLQRLIGEDVQLVTKPAEDLGRVKADPNQIEQVIMNLAVNSRDAMPQGGTLTVQTANVTLDRPLATQHVGLEAGRYVLLSVGDTGCGMSFEVQAHLFEPFFTTKPQGKGTGLGLSTIYGIIKQSGGHIWVESEPGQGTTFRIYLPRIDEPADSVAAVETRTAPQGSETILLVEDEDAVRHLLRDVLKRYGYSVLDAANGGDAIELCRSHPGPIDLVVTDMVMPQISGWEVADAVSALRPKAKIIYMSGYIEHVVVEERVLDTGVAFLGKPFTPEALGRKVREVLDGERQA